MVSLPTLQRDLREVENELRLSRNRLLFYQTKGDDALAADTQRVVAGHETLLATLATRIHSLHAPP